ncbi:MAG: hypothetical protein WKF36_03555 [Candidatus Nitrosocosmicus sp.]
MTHAKHHKVIDVNISLCVCDLPTMPVLDPVSYRPFSEQQQQLSKMQKTHNILFWPSDHGWPAAGVNNIPPRPHNNQIKANAPR